MKKLLLLVCVCIQILSLVTVTWASPQQNTLVQQPSNQALPDQVTYRFFFRKMAFLEAKAISEERQGNNGDKYRNFYNKALQLSPQQRAQLIQIAVECGKKIDVIDSQAKQLIEAYRAQVNGSVLGPGESLPPPPAELNVLGDKRNNVILSAREQIRVVLGDEVFTRVEAFVRQNIGSKITVTSQPQHPDSAKQLPK